MIESGSFFLSQLVFYGPGVLVALLGIILASVFWKRGPGAALMTLLASVFLLVLGLVSIGLNTYFWSALVDGAWSHETYALASRILGIATSLLRAVCVALIIIAVFLGRRPYPQRYD